MKAASMDDVSTNEISLKQFSQNARPVLPPINTFESLPQNLLLTLTQKNKNCEDLGPKKAERQRYSKGKVDNVWNHEKRRAKLKHLTNQPPCYCGSGRDISFLIDATKNKPGKDDDATDSFLVGESLIPSEFHVVQHKGVAALDIQHDKYTTKPEHHDKHLTMFPSMRPSGRQEALRLLKTMDSLLDRVGVNKANENNMDNICENQIECLLKLVEEEQKIYNVVFNEVIRQVSVQCVERGQILAELRQRYASILHKVPQHVKSLHNEVLAQRALDRRLTEELSHFKLSITQLTSELHDVHIHDEEVTQQAVQTQAELNDALKESEKSASLLAQFHDLYELQRRRLDYQLCKLMEERDLWSGCAHTLALKVIDKCDLVTVRRLHVFEKSWFKLANQFSSLLNGEDDKLIQPLALKVNEWIYTVESFHEKLTATELRSCDKMKEVQLTMNQWAKRFQRVVTPTQGSVHPVSTEEMTELLLVLKSWDEIFKKEVERFTGDDLLTFEDSLLQANSCLDVWYDTAIKIFRNHPNNDESVHPRQASLSQMKKQVEDLHKQLKMRMSGENGLNSEITSFLNSIDTWINKIHVFLREGELFFESEWVQLADELNSHWNESLDTIIALLTCGEKSNNSDDDKPLVDTVCEGAQQWITQTTDVVLNENTNILEQISSIHSSMIQWMITVLLRMTPVSPNQNSAFGEAILSECSNHVIVERANSIVNRLHSLTELLACCCEEIVLSASFQKNKGNQVAELKKLEVEYQGWIHTANLLVQNLAGVTLTAEVLDIIPRANVVEFSTFHAVNERVAKETRPSPQIITTTTETSIIEKEEEDDDHPDEMKVIGLDDNITKKLLTDSLTTPHGNPNQQGSCLSLDELTVLERLHAQLLETEKRSQEAEERALQAEASLVEANKRIRALQNKINC